MGTRNLTIVKSKGKTKVAQYGQWDGYPRGQGITIAKFLKTVDLAKFKQQVDALEAHTPKDITKIWQLAGADDSGWVTSDISDKVKQSNPELSRDYGAEVLDFIHKGKVTRVQLAEEFKEDKLFCEYCYTIDLDNETVTVNEYKPIPFRLWTEKKMQTLQDNEDKN